MNTTQDALESPHPSHSTIGTITLFAALLGSFIMMGVAAHKLMTNITQGHEDSSEMINQFWGFIPWMTGAGIAILVALYMYTRVPKWYNADLEIYHKKIETTIKHELTKQYKISDTTLNLPDKELLEWGKVLNGEEGVRKATVYFENSENPGHYKVIIQENGTAGLAKDDTEMSQLSPDIEQYKR